MCRKVVLCRQLLLGPVRVSLQQSNSGLPLIHLVLLRGRDWPGRATRLRCAVQKRPGRNFGLRRQSAYTRTCWHFGKSHDQASDSIEEGTQDAS